MGVPPALLAALLAGGLCLGPAAAQTLPQTPAETGAELGAESDAGSGAGSGPETGGEAWLSRSALKALTYKAATTATNLTVLTVATGGVAAGAALTVFGAAASLAIYAVNDYSWDRNAAPPPPPAPEEAQSFDATDEFWRTTRKFLTYKASTSWIKAIKLAAVYAYTGVMATTLAAVGTATVVNAGFFYVNNFAWDYFNSPGTVAAPPPPPERAAPPAAPAAPAAPADAAPQS